VIHRAPEGPHPWDACLLKVMVGVVALIVVVLIWRIFHA
jgi:hypothetical protein